jgi:farnesyl diphosphate synthase
VTDVVNTLSSEVSHVLITEPVIALSSIEHYQQRINHVLDNKIDALPITDERLLAAIRYGLLVGGKRMRPYLAYITGDALGANLNDIDGIAAALECIHAYSLLHDDLPAMDDDDFRRGKPTCHKAFDEATAILAGDSLQTLAFDILANHNFSAFADKNRIALIQQLVTASGYQGMCGGQALDIAATNKGISLTALENLHALKTGALLQASVLMAAQCAPNASTADKSALAVYAKKVGLAYQVRDDIIDIICSDEQLGKPSGSDVEANKSTYPALLGLEGAQQKAQDLYQQALHALHALPYNSQALSEFATFIINRKN